MTCFEIVVAVVQFVTMIVLIIMLVFTRVDYKSRMRPYIGFEEIKMKDTEKPDEIEFEVNVRNVGQMPAKNAKLYGTIFVTNEENTPFECDTKGSVFPSTTQLPIWLIGVKEIDKDAILRGSKALKLNMTIDYYGSGRGKYWTKSSRTYDPIRKSWLKEEGNWK